MDFAEIALFKRYSVIYLPIDDAIYDVLQASHTLLIYYCTAHATFDRTELLPTELTLSVSAVGRSI